VIERLRVHYGFGRTPFGRDLAPGMLHPHHGHAEAIARITWLISERAIGVITGEVGAGKTVAARAAVAGLDPVRHTIVYIPNPCIGQRGLYAEIIRALGGHPRFHKASLLAQAAELLAAEDAEKAKTTVVIIDEAHLLSGEQLEEVRMLTNHDMDARSPFACLLIGQPTLRRRIKMGTLAALDQRIALRYHLGGMDLGETVSYITHHLQLAGRSDQMFTDDAIGLLHQTARGIPRAVNNLAIQALVAAFVDGKGLVDESAARAAVTEVTSD
jgi:type II secretory pathway predicted ATPase ExeA